jgi:hypothetical protein
MWQVLGRGEVYTGLCWGNLKEIDHLEDLGVDGKIIVKCILKKSNGKSWIGCGLG